MGDFAFQQKVVYPSDDLVAIVADLTGKEELILADGDHNISAPLVLNGLSNIAIRGSLGSRIVSSATSGAVFDIDDCTDVEMHGFEVTAALQSGDIVNVGGANTRVHIHHLTINNNPASGSCDFFDMAGVTAAQNGISIVDCKVRGDIATFFRCATAHASGVSVGGINVVDNEAVTDTKTDDAVVFSNSSDGVVSGCRVDNNSFNGFVQGFTASSFTNAYVNNNIISGCGSAVTDAGFEIGAGCSGILAVGNSVAAQTGIGVKLASGCDFGQGVIILTTAEGIVVSGGTNTPIIGCTINMVGTAGTYAGISITGGTRLQIMANRVLSATGVGIHIPSGSTATACTFSNNIVHSSGDMGIQISAGTDHDINSCRIESPGSSAAALRLDAGVLRSKINANVVLNATSGGCNGIDIQEGADSCSVTNNFVYNTGGDGLNVDADSATVQGNFIAGAGGNGIELGDTGNTTANVMCQGNTATGSGSAGIAVRAVNSVITGNLTYGNTGQGLYEHSSSSGNHFADNKSFSNTGVNFQFDGSSGSMGIENDDSASIVANDLLAYETAASGRRVKRVGLSLDIADVGDGEVLVRDGTEIVGQAASEGSVEANKTWEFLADMFATPNTADWGLNSPAPIITDPTNASIPVAAFDDTTEEGVGMEFHLPTGATKFKIVVEARAASAPGSAQTVDFRLRHRGISDNAVLPSWSTVDMATMQIPTNAYFQYREYEFDVATVSMTAGRSYQLEWSRYTAGDDTLTGDLYVRSIRIFVRYDNVKWVPAISMQNTDSSDWSINGNAPMATDSNNSALKVRLHDDTTEEGCGLVWHVPEGTAKMKLHLRSRAETAPGGAVGVGVTLHYRTLGDNGAPGSWVQYDLPTDVALPTNEYWQYDNWELDMASLATPIVPGTTYQFQITRNPADAGDTLTGDWVTWMYGFEFY